MAELVIALGQAGVDPPLVNREAVTADKSEDQTKKRIERRLIFRFSQMNLRHSCPNKVLTADKEKKNFHQNQSENSTFIPRERFREQRAP